MAERFPDGGHDEIDAQVHPRPRHHAPFERRLLSEVSADDLRALCQKIKGRGAPATAIHARDIVKQIYVFANLHGEKVPNPADDVAAAFITTFVPKDRALSPLGIRLIHLRMGMVATYPTTQLALCLILLTMVRKSEPMQATWDEVGFYAAVWTIPRSRRKARRPHNIHLSQQALDSMFTLRMCAAGSSYQAPHSHGSLRARDTSARVPPSLPRIHG